MGRKRFTIEEQVGGLLDHPDLSAPRRRRTPHVPAAAAGRPGGDRRFVAPAIKATRAGDGPERRVA